VRLPPESLLDAAVIGDGAYDRRVVVVGQLIDARAGDGHAIQHWVARRLNQAAAGRVQRAANDSRVQQRHYGVRSGCQDRAAGVGESVVLQDQVAAGGGLQRARVGGAVARPDREVLGLVGIDGSPALVHQAHLIGANLAGTLDGVVGVGQDIGGYGAVNPVVGVVAHRNRAAAGERDGRGADDQVRIVAAGTEGDAAGTRAVRVGDGGPGYGERRIIFEVQQVGAADREIANGIAHVQLYQAPGIGNDRVVAGPWHTAQGPGGRIPVACGAIPIVVGEHQRPRKRLEAEGMHHETSSRNHPADGLLPEIDGLFGSPLQRRLRKKAGQAGAGNQAGKQ
jgi:hypothetical protein